MATFIPGEISTKDLHQFILGAVSPRPIAFVSSIDERGVANLAPYSFFNAFSSNPPVLVFSSNRRVDDNTTKDTLRNARANGELVINMVNYAIVRQAAIAGISYPPEVSEFGKSGLTPLASERVRPFRVLESPVHFECRVKDIITLGEHGGAGHLVICEVLCLHIDDAVIDERGRIDPHKIDLVGRMGRAHYVRASGAAIFDVYQEPNRIALGFDQLPESIRHSPVLTGNDLALLAGQTELPTESEIRLIAEELPELRGLSGDEVHRRALAALQAGEVRRAFAMLMLS